jgi:hypothetical protein
MTNNRKTHSAAVKVLPIWYTYRVQIALELSRLRFRPDFVDRVLEFKEKFAGTTKWLISQEPDEETYSAPETSSAWGKHLRRWQKKLLNEKKKLFKSCPVFSDAQWGDDKEILFTMLFMSITSELNSLEKPEIPFIQQFKKINKSKAKKKKKRKNKSRT